MTDSSPIQHPEAIPTHVKMPDWQVDVLTITRQIRLCRSTLGAILDELECRDLRTDAGVSIAECTSGVTAEIESLWEAIGKSK
jgi:hypothetical protein